PDNTDIDAALSDADRARGLGEFTVPGRIDRELATNPFFRFDQPSVAQGRDPVASFASIRQAKDDF
ncbi:MAG: hydroxyacylglutathione hydrolase C-terminal domain-containing protein, partial [Myxococcota bacterium]